MLDPFVTLLHTVLVQLSGVLPGPHDLRVVLALVLLTAGLRLAMLPLSIRAHRGMEARKAMAPEVARLQKRHGHDRQRLAEELTKAHRKAGVSLFAGLGPMLAQGPVLMLLYRLVTTTAVGGQANTLSTVSVLGTPLSAHWLPVLSTGAWGPLLLGGLLLASLLLVAHLQARKVTEGPEVLRLLPYGSLVFAAIAPVAFSVYLLTTTTWSLAERAVLPRLA